jgi:hypothetical protein
VRAGGDTLNLVRGYERAYAESITPTEDTTLLTWLREVAEWNAGTWENVQVELHASRVQNGGVTDELVEILAQPWLVPEVVLSGDANTVFVRRPDGALTAIDATSWTTKWTLTDAGPVAPLPDGSLLVDTGEPTLSEIGTTGELVAAAIPAVVVSDRRPLAFGVWAGTSPNGIEVVTGPQVQQAFFSFQAESGNTQRQRAPARVNAGVFAKAHRVLAGLPYHHFAIRIQPRNQQFWRSHPQLGEHFDNRDPNSGLFFATIGAGPEPDGCSGALKSDINRTRDVHASYTRLELLEYPAASEDSLIAQFFARDANYGDDLQYECFPDPGTNEFNSNSYATGLINATGVPQPKFKTELGWQLPGAEKPVPTNNFD